MTFPTAPVQRTAASATVAQPGQVRGRPPVATVSANQGTNGIAAVFFCFLGGGEVSKLHIFWLCFPPTPIYGQFFQPDAFLEATD